MPRGPDEHVYKLKLHNEVHEALRKFLGLPDELVSTITSDVSGRVTVTVRLREGG